MANNWENRKMDECYTCQQPVGESECAGLTKMGIPLHSKCVIHCPICRGLSAKDESCVDIETGEHHYCVVKKYAGNA